MEPWSKIHGFYIWAPFYERAKKAYAVVVTGETAKYGNIIIKKGVTPICD